MCGQFYSSGVYDSATCSSFELNHAMLITGYGTYNNQDYWLVKNRCDIHSSKPQSYGFFSILS